ncbi:hypothetical protein B0H14DRAFT_2636086 [Mycena olivaceomarginata]|nr:hypothetical protein B0H14DRAFT_2636086 [Mycena olivaceomarginata]
MSQFLAEGRRVYEHGQKKIEEHTVIFDLDLLFPDHFAGGTRDYMLMAQNVVEGGWLELSELPDIMTDNQLKLLIKTNDMTPEQLQNFGSNQYPCNKCCFKLMAGNVFPKHDSAPDTAKTPQFLGQGDCFWTTIPKAQEPVLQYTLYYCQLAPKDCVTVVDSKH